MRKGTQDMHTYSTRYIFFPCWLLKEVMVQGDRTLRFTPCRRSKRFLSSIAMDAVGVSTYVPSAGRSASQDGIVWQRQKQMRVNETECGCGWWLPSLDVAWRSHFALDLLLLFLSPSSVPSVSQPRISRPPAARHRSHSKQDNQTLPMLLGRSPGSTREKSGTRAST
jgi:hypothetical protein